MLLPWCSSVCLSVWDICALRSYVAWVPWHQSMSTYCHPSSSSSNWKRGGVYTDKCKLGMVSQKRLKVEVRLLLSANRKSYMAHRWHNNRWPSVTLNGLFPIVHNLCGSGASCLLTVPISCVETFFSVLWHHWLVRWNHLHVKIHSSLSSPAGEEASANLSPYLCWGTANPGPMHFVPWGPGKSVWVYDARSSQLVQGVDDVCLYVAK